MVEIEVNSDQGVYELIINGEIDASSSIHLDNAMSIAVEQHKKQIMVDCRSLRYISSAGLGVFISYLEDFKNNKTQFVIFGLNDKVKHVFELIGLDSLFIVVPTKDDAISYLNDSQA
ncbi:MAG: STAS domain-containing protein [Bacteroidetes bacterium]|nr:STAS domain-containing protein [Bacteroidota bacterium]MDA1121695.1 STAS domain-containing protein [Bacteroidota bacterium]